jgi:hypothetical protein
MIVAYVEAPGTQTTSLDGVELKHSARSALESIAMFTALQSGITSEAKPLLQLSLPTNMEEPEEQATTLP